ncbi:sigma-70 family RNA polymerase sigma factor [Archangium violaceum]|uniref:RNA polymerase sigma factor n=1 Tax=Archangium violaceum TaxID=83451 RepID=UPI002B29DCA7|nr:sigma-70 family RNA polymerase sigma factor [Archangium gephyra]
MSELTDADHAALVDELLVVRCQLGERPAFDALVARWRQPLWRYARNLAGNDAAADDAAQDIWVRVLRGIGALRDAARLRSWLFGIAHRVMMDRLREHYARPESVDIEAEDLPADDGNALELELELASMLDELARLPLVENEVLTLFYLRELSLDDIAQALGIPPGTVKSRLHRARKMLRQQLQREGVCA